MALGCPTTGLEFDPKTLALIDTDKDGRIRVPEIIAAAKWAAGMLKDPDELLKGSSSLPLAAINDATPEGKQLLASARQILVNLGNKDATAISVDDMADTARIFAQTHFNGDGIIPVESAEDDPTRAVIKDIIACLGPQTDRSGKPGISQPTADQFFAELQVYADWWTKAQADGGVIFPLGEAGTVAAAASLGAVRAKIDDYFARGRLAAFDPRALSALNRQESEYLAIAARDLTITSVEIAGFPLARIEGPKPLSLAQGLNPAWVCAMATFQAQAISPLLGSKDALTEAEWTELAGKFAAYDAWLAQKPTTAIEKLGLERAREILAGGSRAAINSLIAQDKALEPEATAIAAVDKLVRYNRDLYKLLNNFVTFRDFYGRKEKAIFQAGTLYLDQRSCELCVRVDDPAKHAAMAGLGRMYLAYCDVVRKSTREKMIIAAAFTAGDSDNLMVGRNGIFYDRNGQDWDATITRIIDNPISIRQAFWAPYKRTIRWVEEQVTKRATAADAAATQKLTASAEHVGTAATTGQAPPQKPKIDIGVVAALGVAVGGITAAMGVLLQTFFGLGAWMPIGFVALILAISGPSMVIAWLKLRQRNLGPMLDAGGWAVNARAKININFGRILTDIAKLPPGAKRDFVDPYAESRATQRVVTVVVVVLALFLGAWYFGAIERVLPGWLPQSQWGEESKAARAAHRQWDRRRRLQ